MSKFNKLKYIAAALPCLLMGMAHAGNVSEFEPNNPIAGPQHLVSAVNTSVQSFLGNNGSDDLDYYMFYANAGDVLTIDIDNGYGDAASVDTMIYLMDSSTSHTVLRFDDDATSLDSGSTSNLDARIDNFVAPSSGYYIVAVTNYPRYLTPRTDGTIFVNNPLATRQGDYTVVVSGATPTTMQIAILIKPGNNNIAPINPLSHGKIPVAILGGPGFDTKDINVKSLTFGSSGGEASLSKCNSQRVDLNGDGRPDLLCHFNNQAAHFKVTDAEATLRGETNAGVQFEGTGFMKVVPMKGGAH